MPKRWHTYNRHTTQHTKTNAIWISLPSFNFKKCIYCYDLIEVWNNLYIFCTVDDCKYNNVCWHNVCILLMWFAYYGRVLFDNFTFYISWFDCIKGYILSILILGLYCPMLFYVNASHGVRASVAGCRLYINYYISTVCTKCLYVHRSHRNAFSCCMCCLSLLPSSTYVGDVFHMVSLILKD